MTIRANFTNSFLIRYAFIAVVCLGFMFWCLYDGLIGYPKLMEPALAFQAIQEREPKPSDSDAKREFLDLAKENDWKMDAKKFEKISSISHLEADIFQQFSMAVVSVAIGLPFLILLVRCRGSWMEASETGIHTSWGQAMQFDQITLLNKRKWNDKGIAKVQYESEGSKRKLVLDDCKFDRDPTEEMLRLIESHISLDQFVNGEPEALPGTEEMLRLEEMAEEVAEQEATSTGQE